MKKKLHRIVAFALAFIMTWGSMGLTFPVLVNATGTETENEALIGNSFHIDFTDITGDELDRYFSSSHRNIGLCVYYRLVSDEEQ